MGKFNQDGVSYVTVAEKRGATYFKLDNWNSIEEMIGKENMWFINEQFLEQQLEQGKIFILSHNPETATGYYAKEIEFLVQHGYEFIKSGDIWKAIIK